MRFLIDMPLSPRLVTWLEQRGHDAVHASSLGLERAPDTEILDRAVADRRLVITVDSDFPQLLALSREVAPGIILIRGGDHTTAEVRGFLIRVLEAAPEATLLKSICVVDRRGIRCRALPLRPTD